MQASKWLSSFSRRIGRSLSPSKKTLLAKYMPALGIDIKQHETITAHALFGDNRPLHIEIGFGYGEYLYRCALENPAIGYIGCEPYINGVANLYEKLDQGVNHSNIRVFTDDARPLLSKLSDNSVTRICVLFPDPWPKPRHHKRRLISGETLDMFARIQPSGAQLLLATDHLDYSAWILQHVLAHHAYEWCARSKEDWEAPPANWVPTRYQQKTTEEGRAPVFIQCQRV